MTSDLNTKAAEIRAGLVDRLRDDRHCNDWYLRQEAAALIEQLAAELAAKDEEIKETAQEAQDAVLSMIFMPGVRAALDALPEDDPIEPYLKRIRDLEAAEAERDELLREKETSLSLLAKEYGVEIGRAVCLVSTDGESVTDIYDIPAERMPHGYDYAEELATAEKALSEARSENEALRKDNARLEAGWQDLSTVPEDEMVIVATTGGWVGEATVIDGEWRWAAGNVFHSDIVPLKWMPLPDHPEALENGPADLADAHSKSPDPSSQSERIAVLEAALRPFVALADSYFYRYETQPGVFRESHQDDPDDRAVYGINRVEITTGDFRRARSALAPLGEE